MLEAGQGLGVRSVGLCSAFRAGACTQVCSSHPVFTLLTYATEQNTHSHTDDSKHAGKKQAAPRESHAQKMLDRCVTHTEGKSRRQLGPAKAGHLQPDV